MTLGECCGSRRWLERMAALQPFADHGDLHEKAERAWAAMAENDWLEAFATHPKIGARAASPVSSEEQAGMRGAKAEIQERMAALNEEYERKFGFIYIVCATGKGADEMLRNLEERLRHNRPAELAIAAAEQGRIMHLRLDKLTWEFPHTF